MQLKPQYQIKTKIKDERLDVFESVISAQALSHSNSTLMANGVPVEEEINRVMFKVSLWESSHFYEDI